MSEYGVTQTNTTELFYGAWRKVRGNAGTAGVDGETAARFEKNLFYNLSNMAEQFEQCNYNLSPFKCVYIPKKTSGLRCIGIPTVRDRIILHAVNTHLLSRWDQYFSDLSFAYRHGKSRHDAIKAICEFIEGGDAWYFKGDIRGCFDSLDWSLLSTILKKALPDEAIRYFVNKSFRMPFVYKGTTFPRYKGVPMGSPISPTLANVYLHQFDAEISDLGYAVIRYGDDWICMTHSQESALRGFNNAREILDYMRISLNRTKNGIGNLERETIQFLGYDINASEIVPRSGNARNF
jgi:CRISPR-associated protein Cas1